MKLHEVILAIPSAGRPEILSKLLNLIDQQTNPHFAVVCLNDGNHPQTAHVLSKRYRFNLYSFSSPERSGLPGARNKILNFIQEKNLAQAKDTYVAFLDDDVLIQNDFVEQIHHYKKSWDGFYFRIIQKGPSSTLDLVDYPLLQKLFSLFIGTCNLTLGFIFGGFYIPTGKIHRTKHLNGGCLIYNFSKNKELRFDEKLNRGNFIMEDTCFSHELHRRGNKLAYISAYTYVHEPALEGGCRIDNREDRFYWYWKHKFYLSKKFGNKLQPWSCKLFAFPESLLFSIVTRRNLTPYYFSALTGKQ